MPNAGGFATWQEMNYEITLAQKQITTDLDYFVQQV